MAKNKTGIAVSATNNGLVFTNRATGETLSLSVQKGKLVADKSGLAEGKSRQYGNYIAKFASDFATIHSKSGSWDKRFARLLKPIAGSLDSITNFRQLSNRLRAPFFGELIDPVTGNPYFFEGAKYE